jgi:hypothetical protein
VADPGQLGPARLRGETFDQPHGDRRSAGLERGPGAPHIYLRSHEHRPRRADLGGLRCITLGGACVVVHAQPARRTVTAAFDGAPHGCRILQQPRCGRTADPAPTSSASSLDEAGSAAANEQPPSYRPMAAPMDSAFDPPMAAWPISDPFLVALWLGALRAAADHQPVELDDPLCVLARDCLARWPAHARA